MLALIVTIFCFWFFLCTELGRFLAVVGLGIGLLFALGAAAAAR